MDKCIYAGAIAQGLLSSGRLEAMLDRQTDRQDIKTKEERRSIPFSGQALHCHGASVYSVRGSLSSENSLFFYVLSPYFLQYRDLGFLASEPAKHRFICVTLFSIVTFNDH